jgi:heme exporter protein D
MKKHALPLALCTIAVLVLLPAAVFAHRGYIHQLTLENARQTAQRLRQAAKVQAEAQATAHKLQVANTDIILLVAQCKQGQANYNLLTPYQKQHAKALYCNYNSVQ